jgi:hypothetical protein
MIKRIISYYVGSNKIHILERKNMTKLTAKVVIDLEITKIIESMDLKDLENFIQKEMSKGIMEDLDKIAKEEFDKMFGSGKYDDTPTSISFPIWQENMKKLGFPRPLRKTIWSDIDGGWTYEPSSLFLLDFNSMHPSMGIDYAKAMKPKNKYERMMRRRNGHTR